MKKPELKNLLLAIVGVTALGVVTAEAADLPRRPLPMPGRPYLCRSSPGPASMSASTPATRFGDSKLDRHDLGHHHRQLQRGWVHDRRHRGL